METLTQREEDIKRMLAAKVHLGTTNSDYQMTPYIWRRNSDGVHIINIGKTLEKLQLAARIIVAIENPADIVAVSARVYGTRAVLKFAHYSGCEALTSRFTPGTFTNQRTRNFKEPRLLIVTDPRMDSQPVLEASYVNIPVIALCNSDSPLRFIDCAIPCNNRSKYSLGVMYWLLAREVQRLRGEITPAKPWDVSVDLFFHKEPEDIERMMEEKTTAAAAAAGANAALAQDNIEGYEGQEDAAYVDYNAAQQVPVGYEAAPSGAVLDQSQQVPVGYESAPPAVLEQPQQWDPAVGGQTGAQATEKWSNM